MLASSTQLKKTMLLAALTAISGCTTLENAYHSAYTGVVGESKEYKDSPTKVEVKSAAAAPVQDVKTQEIVDQKPVELGAIRDGSLDNTTATTTEKTAAPAATEAPKAAEAVKTEQPAAATTPTISLATPPTEALLTLRFNQPHLSYDDALNQAIAAAEKAKPGVVYEVLSTVPDLSSLPAEQQTKLAGRAKENLRNVVTKIQQANVPADRIRIAEQTLKIRSQEIQVYVR